MLEEAKVHKAEEHEEIAEDEDEGSLGQVAEEKICKTLMKGNSYQSRNVYKSIIGHMHAYLRKNREDIVRVLLGTGFTMVQVEHAFFKMYSYYDQLKDKRGKSQPQPMIDKMLAKKTIFTYMLRETLNAIFHNWEVGKYGKVLVENAAVYHLACEKIYSQVLRLVGEPAQGTTFNL